MQKCETIFMQTCEAIFIIWHCYFADDSSERIVSKIAMRPSGGVRGVVAVFKTNKLSSQRRLQKNGHGNRLQFCMKSCFAYTKPLFPRVPPSFQKSRNWFQRLDFWVPFCYENADFGGIRRRQGGVTQLSRSCHAAVTQLSPK